MQRKVEEVARLCETRRREQERSVRLVSYHLGHGLFIVSQYLSGQGCITFHFRQFSETRKVVLKIQELLRR